VISRLKELGFETLTQTQEAAIQKGLFDNKSLLVSAPTNTGKTFIGELAALNASRQKEPRRSFFLVPLKALAEQMFKSLVEKYEEWGLNVAISTSDHYEYDNALMDFDVVISTYEKLNALLVKNPNIARDIGLVVIDEIQHVGDSDRGITLEMLLTRLRISTNNVQLIGLSATISNAETLAKWLGSLLVKVDKRDVELREGVLYTGSDSIRFRGFTVSNGDFLYREFNSGKIDVERKLNLNLIPQIIEQSKREQCLVFVDTQPNAEETARRIARDLPELPEMNSMIKELDALVESTPSTTKMKKILNKGVAFHHAGLLADERRIVESGFAKGLIKVICSTLTLGAGVNTPAKNVIILFNRYYDGSQMLVTTYKNISGRAGRLRKAEEFGRSLLLANNERELEFLWDNYINAKPETIASQITKTSGLDCSILGLISSKTCSSQEELMFCMQMTFFGFLVSEQFPGNYKEILAKTLKHEVDRLVKMGFVVQNEKLETTELGLRCAEELLSPETTLFLYQTIAQNEAKFLKGAPYEKLVPGIIHLCCCTNDADRLFSPRSQTEIQELVATWEVDKDSYFCKPTDRELFLKSLRTTRMLLRWIEGISYFDLSPYAPPGIIKRIADTTQWISRGMARLAEKPLFSFENEFLDFLYELSERVYFGVPKEALAIMKLRVNGIHRRRALNLAKAGYLDIDSLLEADIENLKKVDDIGDILALRLKESVEKYIESESQRMKAAHVRLAVRMGKDLSLILGLYEAHGDDLSKHIAKLLKDEFTIDATFVGESGEHEPDIVVSTTDGNIVIEAKRKESGRVSAKESEEILGKGAKYKPIAHVTIGYPDFVEVAKENAISSKVTLITVAMIGEITTRFWRDEIKIADILTLLKSGKCVYEIGSYYLKKK